MPNKIKPRREYILNRKIELEKEIVTGRRETKLTK